jgi:tRNA G18 (ribose-2'-O)-methylase SpoU
MKTIHNQGYFAIGIYRGKTEHNIGTLWRAAYILGASYIFTIEKRYKKQTSDVLKTWARIPMFHYRTMEDFLKSIPYDCRIIGIEMSDASEMLSTFQHPKRGIYLLGAEDEGLPQEIINACHYLVKLPGNNSLNVSVAGSIVVHDRVSKIPADFPPYHKQ